MGRWEHPKVISTAALFPVSVQVCSYIYRIGVDVVSRKRSFLYRDSINLPGSPAILEAISITLSGSYDGL